MLFSLESSGLEKITIRLHEVTHELDEKLALKHMIVFLKNSIQNEEIKKGNLDLVWCWRDFPTKYGSANTNDTMDPQNPKQFKLFVI